MILFARNIHDFCQMAELINLSLAKQIIFKWKIISAHIISVIIAYFDFQEVPFDFSCKCLGKLWGKKLFDIFIARISYLLRGVGTSEPKSNFCIFMTSSTSHAFLANSFA